MTSIAGVGLTAKATPELFVLVKELADPLKLTEVNERIIMPLQ